MIINDSLKEKGWKHENRELMLAQRQSKWVILNEDKQLIFKKYQRHFADVANCVLDVLSRHKRYMMVRQN